MSEQRRLGRRRFLAEAAGGVVAGTALHGAPTPIPDRVRIAVVGAGARGSDLIRKLTTIDSARIVAVCDDYAPHLERGVKYAGAKAKAYSSFDQMLREARPQAVVVATPLHRHAEMCLAAIDAGCDVFCEKTMCYSVEEAEEIVRSVEKNGSVFQVGLQRRANAIYRQAKAMIESGFLGRIAAIKCQWHRNNDWRRPVPVGRDHSDWPGLERRLNWRLYRSSSRGLLTELASHQLDVATWLLGAAPTRVQGTGGIDWWRDGREVEDNLFCTWEYELPPEAGERNLSPASSSEPYRVRVTWSSIQNNAYEGASELILGTKGTLFLTQKKGLFYRETGVDDPGWSKDGRVRHDADVITSGKTLKMANDPWAHRGKPFEIDTESDDTRDELIAFLDCVGGRDVDTISTARNGLVNSATVITAYKAVRSGQRLELPV